MLASPGIATEDRYGDGLGPLPENCGIVRSSAPLTGDLSEILLDDGAGNLRTFYFYPHLCHHEKQCGDMTGKICFTIMGTIPVNAKLAARGVTGERITIIRECMEVD